MNAREILLLAEHKDKLEKIAKLQEELRERREEADGYLREMAVLKSRLQAVEYQIEDLHKRIEKIINEIGAATGIEADNIKALLSIKKGRSLSSSGTRKPRTYGLRAKIEEYFRERPGTMVKAATIAEVIGANVGAVQRVLNKMVEEGFLARTTHKRSYLYCLKG